MKKIVKTPAGETQDISPEKQIEINNEAIDQALLSQWKKIKGPQFERFVAHMHALGARLFVRFHDGRELELPLPAISSTETDR